MARHPIFQPVETGQTSARVRQYLESLILEGALKPGEQLPAERDLAKHLAVSRPVLREALKELEDRNLIRTRHGGGSYVTSIIGAGFVDPLVQLLRQHPEAEGDYLEYRKEIESGAAYYAAIRATESDCEIIGIVFEEMKNAHVAADAEREAVLDAQFHMAIVEASHNLVIMHVTQAMYDLLRDDVVYSRGVLHHRAGVRESLLEQHGVIKDAVVAGNPECARSAMRDHLSYVQDCFRDFGRYRTREAIAAQRLSQLRDSLQTTPGQGTSWADKPRG